MADLSQLSDDDLRKLYAQQSSPLSSVSDDQLKEMYAKSTQNPDSNLGGTLQLGVPFTGARLDTHIPLPASLESGIVGAGKTTARLLQGVNPFTKAGDVAEEERLYKPLSEAHPVATTVGEIAPYLLTGNPLASAAMAGAEYGTAGERATRAAMAFGGAKVGQGLGRMFGPDTMKAAPTLAGEFFENSGNRWGIPTTMGQNGSKTAALAESVLSNLPFGGAVNRARDASYQGFNRAVSRSFGEDLAKITPDALGDAQSKIGGKIGDLAERNTLVPDFRLAQELAAVSTRAQKNLSSDGSRVVDNWIQELLSKQQQGGGIAGTNYRAWRSDVGALAKSEGGTLGNILGDLKGTVTKAMDRSIVPEDASAWAKANREYFNVKQVGDASRATPGSLSPSQLLTQVNKAQPNARYGGGNELADLAQWAKTTLPDKIPNSGTAQRLFMQKLLTNPVGAGTGLLGLGYGANATGLSDINPAYFAAPVALPFLAAHATSGKPLSEAMKKMLSRGGGLLGYELAPQ